MGTKDKKTAEHNADALEPVVAAVKQASVNQAKQEVAKAKTEADNGDYEARNKAALEAAAVNPQPDHDSGMQTRKQMKGK